MLLWPRPYPGLASIYVLLVARFLFRLEFQAPARVISDAFDFLFFLCLRPKRQYRCCVCAVFLGRTTVFYGNFILFPVPKLSDTKGHRLLRCFFVLSIIRVLPLRPGNALERFSFCAPPRYGIALSLLSFAFSQRHCARNLHDKPMVKLP